MNAALLGEFESADTMLQALRALHGAKHTELETFTPFDLPEVDATLGFKRSRVGWMALLGGVAGFAFSYWIQWWTAVNAYPLNVGARPMNTPQAFALITFESTVLGAALSGFVALIFTLGFPRLWAREDEVDGFERSSIDRFWIRVNRPESAGTEGSARQIMQGCGALRVVTLGDK